jgi:Cu2+-exporting ATPase
MDSNDDNASGNGMCCSRTDATAALALGSSRTQIETSCCNSGVDKAMACSSSAQDGQLNSCQPGTGAATRKELVAESDKNMPGTGCEKGCCATQKQDGDSTPARQTGDGDTPGPPPCCDGKPSPCCDESCLDRLALRTCRDEKHPLEAQSDTSQST